MKRSSVIVRALLAGFVITCGALAVWLWNARPAHAAGSTQNEKLCLCTGQLDGGGEVVYVLDALTGDLKAFTMHQNGKFNASYYRNILQDFRLDKETAKPQFTMVTGQEQFSRRGPVTPINSVLYVAEATSGKMAAYTLVWNSTASTRPSRARSCRWTASSSAATSSAIP
jgi:hypothetical protein